MYDFDVFKHDFNAIVRYRGMVIVLKILILGGAGGMALGGASYLIRYEDVSKVVLADLNRDKLNQIKHNFDSPKIDTLVLDVLEKEVMIKKVKEYDVVLNCIGPFTKFGVHILKTVIEAGVNYVDICDDHDAAKELLELDSLAKEHGVSALICMGTTPGISNVQARYAYDMLDTCDSLKIAWAITTPPLDKVKGTPLEMTVENPRALMTEATWDHLLHVSSNRIPIWKKGKWDEIDALEVGEWVDFAEPLGRAESYYIGHAEPITLAHHLDIKDFSACLGSIMPSVMKQLRLEARGHKDATHPPQPSNSPVWEAPDLWKDRGVWGGQAAIAEGTKNGKRIRITCRIMMGVDDINGYNNSGQAIGTYMMGKKMFKQSGVFAPEAVIDPKAFFDELAAYYTQDSNTEFTADTLVLVEKEILDPV